MVYDNFRPGVLKRLGIDYDTLKQCNLKIISCSVSGFGGNGPWRDQPAFDLVIQALSGAMSITGEEPGRMPIRWGVAIGDLAAGLFSVIGILCALRARDYSGVGQRVDISMLDSLLSLHTYRIPQTFGTGMKFGPQPRRSGAGQVPYGPYKTKDGGWFVIAAGAEQFWASLCKITNREELLKDPKFENLAKL